MNWTMIGALGEVLGALGVIATLAYLAHQVRANTRQMQMAAERELYDSSRQRFLQLAGDLDMARIWRVGTSGGQLDLDEHVQLSVQFLELTFDWLRSYDFAEAGEITSRMADANRRVRRDVTSLPAYRAWFEARKHWFPDDFREALEREMEAEGGSYAPPWAGESGREDAGI